VETIERIESKLRSIPSVSVESSASSICVRPEAPGSFEVRLEHGPTGFVVYLEGWHEEFDSESSAMKCFAWALSPACRLRVEYRGATPVSWQVESEIDGAWVGDSKVGLILRPFWRRRRVEYLRNHVWPAV
jgi:hypothetical protein